MIPAGTRRCARFRDFRIEASWAALRGLPVRGFANGGETDRVFMYYPFLSLSKYVNDFNGGVLKMLPICVARKCGNAASTCKSTIIRQAARN